MRRLTLSAPLLCAARLPTASIIPRLVRFQSTASTSDAPVTASLSPRWLSDLKTRIGRCIMFGLTAEQTREAGTILREMGDNWRELVAGSEGFLTGKGRWGLYRREVIWGEMVA